MESVTFEATAGVRGMTRKTGGEVMNGQFIPSDGPSPAPDQTSDGPSPAPDQTNQCMQHILAAVGSGPEQLQRHASQPGQIATV